jgi:hypothetical protein
VRAIVTPILLLVAAGACERPASDVDSARTLDDARQAREISRVRSELVRLTGAHVRAVWTRDVGDGTDIISSGEQLLLMGLDSQDPRGERPILPGPSGYSKPLITPKGDRVVFSKPSEEGVYVVDWDGGGERRLASGFALALWQDPESSQEWVYVGSKRRRREPTSYHVIERHQIDHPEVSEPVWNGEPVTINSFQIARDGRSAGGLFPWPKAGVADLETGTWHPLGEGCWTAFAADDSHLFWFFDGSHRNLTIVDVDGNRRWRVAINDAPEMRGFEVYHPRWTNQPRFLAVTGPYTVGDAANKIRGGGPQVEIFLGRFAADFMSVESWQQVTHNDAADFYPDVWIDPAAPAFVTDVKAAGPPTVASEDTSAGRTRRLIVDAEVLDDVAVPTVPAIAPYRHALIAMEYAVVDVVEGSYDGEKLLVAHWVIRDKRVLENAARHKGERYRLTLELYDDHPELESQRLVMDTDEFLLSLYYDTNSASHEAL